jgi:hypothetical protein
MKLLKTESWFSMTLLFRSGRFPAAEYLTKAITLVIPIPGIHRPQELAWPTP